MKRPFTFLAAVLCALILSFPAQADLIRAPDVDLSGTGLGAVLTVLVIRADVSESGCVYWTGSADATGSAGCPVLGGFGGDEQTGQNSTYRIGDLGLGDFGWLRIIFDGIESGGDESVWLDDLVLFIQSSSGGPALTSYSLPSAVFFDAFPGTGQSSYNFMLDQTQATLANAYLGFPDYRLGLAAAVSWTSSGHESFSFYVVPEPMSFVLIGAGLLALGLARGLRRKTPA